MCALVFPHVHFFNGSVVGWQTIYRKLHISKKQRNCHFRLSQLGFEVDEQNFVNLHSTVVRGTPIQKTMCRTFTLLQLNRVAHKSSKVRPSEPVADTSYIPADIGGESSCPETTRRDGKRKKVGEGRTRAKRTATCTATSQHPCPVQGVTVGTQTSDDALPTYVEMCQIRQEFNVRTITADDFYGIDD